jgi:polyhydroxybutyrate depolymerase
MQNWNPRLSHHHFFFHLIALLALCLVVAAACSGVPHRGRGGGMRASQGGMRAPQPEVAGLSSGSLQFQGQQRTFKICAPSSKSSNSYPIVMFLHGGYGGGATLAASTGLCDHVDQRQFIGVFPDAVGNQWNDGRETTVSNIDDVGFIKALISYVSRQYGGDAQRVFVAGPSNGGNMAMRLACEATDSFRAYGVVVANMPENLVGRCPQRPIPILFIQSRDDPATPWVGRDQPEPSRGKGKAKGGLLMSAPDTVAFFAKASGCGPVTVTDLPDRVNDGTTVRLHTYTGCKGGSEVIQYEVIGAGHGWPGSTENRSARMTEAYGKVSQEINATDILLDFFARHGM